MDQLSPTLKKLHNFKWMDTTEPWSEADLASAIEMYNKGYSMGRMAQEFKGRTRNAMAGLFNRLRKKGHVELRRDKLNNRTPQSRLYPGIKVIRIASKPRQPKVVAAKPKKRFRLKMIESVTAVTLLELEQHHCRWGIGDPRNSDFRFCGCTRVSLKGSMPYCAEHTIRASHRSEPAPTGVGQQSRSRQWGVRVGG